MSENRFRQPRGTAIDFYGESDSRGGSAPVSDTTIGRDKFQRPCERLLIASHPRAPCRAEPVKAAHLV
jgi:hypothetical protein